MPVSGGAGFDESLVYLLSFWHYALYLSACCFGRPRFHAFVAGALVLKGAALAALIVAMTTVSWSWPPLALMAAGFALNAWGAGVLGLARTYYGWELGEVAFERCDRWPFCVIPHPMLVGNMLGFGGALVNVEFLERWWPLATVHVFANVGLLLIEASNPPPGVHR